MLDAKGGEGLSMLDLGGAVHLGGAYDSFILALYVFMCDTLCIHVYLYALHYILMVVVVM